MSVFVHSPDWSEPLVERLAWLTDVIGSEAGMEQRIRLREHPRRSLEYATLAGGDAERVRLEHALLTTQGAGALAPWWLDAWSAPALLPSGSASIAMPTAGRDLVGGGTVALVHGWNVGTATIDHVDPGYIDLASPLSMTWPAGTRIVPVAAARLQDAVPLDYHCDAVGSAHLAWLWDEEWALSPAVETADHRGYPVLTPQSNWSEKLGTEWSRALDVFDPDLGLRSVIDRSGVSQVSRAHAFTLGSRVELADFRAWLAARAGRCHPFWLPSNQADVRLTGTTASGSVTLIAENRGYAGLPAGDARIGRRDVMILTTSGARIYRRILGAVAIDDDTEQMTLDAPPGVALSPSSVALVSFMRFVRLAQDEVEIVHHTDEVAQASLRLASLRDDA